MECRNEETTGLNLLFYLSFKPPRIPLRFTRTRITTLVPGWCVPISDTQHVLSSRLGAVLSPNRRSKKAASKRRLHNARRRLHFPRDALIKSPYTPSARVADTEEESVGNVKAVL